MANCSHSATLQDATGSYTTTALGARVVVRMVYVYVYQGIHLNHPQIVRFNIHNHEFVVHMGRAGALPQFSKHGNTTPSPPHLGITPR